jgi:excisionase family DNA binding protein
MSKSDLFVSLAQIPDGDPRLDAINAVLAGKTEAKPPASIRLLRMGQAAAETGLSRCTIWRAIREGRIKTVEIRRGSHRISLSELQRFCRGDGDGRRNG